MSPGPGIENNISEHSPANVVWYSGTFQNRSLSPVKHVILANVPVTCRQLLDYSAFQTIEQSLSH